MKNTLIFILLISSFSSFSQTKKSSETKKITTGCQVVEKAFVNKGGKASDFKEIYLRCSVQDYYIKFCESKVSRKNMEKYVNEVITVTYEVKDGEWDICEGDPEMQSRIGTYAIILKIKKNKPKGSNGKGSVRYL